jgi:hypothetical protein
MSDKETLPRVVPRDVPDYHERQAAHLSALAETDKAADVKDRLVQEAETHKRLAFRQKIGRWWRDKVARWHPERR